MQSPRTPPRQRAFAASAAALVLPRLALERQLRSQAHIAVWQRRDALEQGGGDARLPVGEIADADEEADLGSADIIRRPDRWGA
jgi:hypothetical protein